MQTMQCQQGCNGRQTQVPQACAVCTLHCALICYNFILRICFEIAPAAYVQPNFKLKSTNVTLEGGDA